MLFSVEFSALREECANLRRRIQDIEMEMKTSRRENNQLQTDYTKLQDSYKVSAVNTGAFPSIAICSLCIFYNVTCIEKKVVFYTYKRLNFWQEVSCQRCDWSEKIIFLKVRKNSGNFEVGEGKMHSSQYQGILCSLVKEMSGNSRFSDFTKIVFFRTEL